MIWEKDWNKKKEDVCLKLRIDFKWLVWTPKRGKFAGKTKFVCVSTSPDSDPYLGTPAIIAGFKKNSKEINMHLASVTPYQFMENTKHLKNRKIKNKLNEKFSEYQIMWEGRRQFNVAKGLLSK